MTMDVFGFHFVDSQWTVHGVAGEAAEERIIPGYIGSNEVLCPAQVGV